VFPERRNIPKRPLYLLFPDGFLRESRAAVHRASGNGDGCGTVGGYEGKVYYVCGPGREGDVVGYTELW
jgi:hypothetical protein